MRIKNLIKTIANQRIARKSLKFELISAIKQRTSTTKILRKR